MFVYPPFADVFLRRMAALGLQPGATWFAANPGLLEDNYKRQSWDHILTIARENQLDYIVQFRSVHYPVVPVYENSELAVYEVK